MEPAYVYKMPAGTPLFRAKTIEKTGRWHTLSLQDAYTYGPTITEFATNKELRLINLMSLTFHNDLMDRLMIRYPGPNHDGVDIDKLLCLIPLGLFDTITQNIALGSTTNHPLPQNDANWNPLMEFGHRMLHSRQRFSEHTIDTKFTNILEEIYGDVYDGLISPIKWPTKCHAGGGYFPREMCIFKSGMVNEVQEHLRPDAVAAQPSVAVQAVAQGGNRETNGSYYMPLIKLDLNMPSVMVYRDWNPFLDDGFRSEKTNETETVAEKEKDATTDTAVQPKKRIGGRTKKKKRAT